jgi:hypothetical protein
LHDIVEAMKEYIAETTERIDLELDRHEVMLGGGPSCGEVRDVRTACLVHSFSSNSWMSRDVFRLGGMYMMLFRRVPQDRSSQLTAPKPY